MAPQNLRRQVGGARLGRHRRRLDGALNKQKKSSHKTVQRRSLKPPVSDRFRGRHLEDDDDFELFFEQIGRRDVVEGRLGRDLVHDRHRPDEEDVRLLQVHAHLATSSRIASRFRLCFV